MTEKRSINKLLLFGHLFECFNDTLYGFFAVILAPVFFQSTSPSVSLMASYGAFAAGYLARPFGALMFGLYGDRVGRRKPILCAMIMIGVPTFIMGAVPTYESIGILAPLVLITCRVAQGLFMGGAYTGVNLHLSENNTQKNIGSQTGILIASGVFGAVLATIFGAFMSFEFMPTWGWRVPFLFGGICAIIIFFYRLHLSETESFIQEKANNTLLKFPLMYLFKEHKIDLLMACVIAGLAMIPLYYSTIFGNRLFKELGYSRSESLFLNMLAMIFGGVLLIYSGRIADKLGFKKHMLMSTSLIAALAFPAFFLISSSAASTLHICGFIMILMFTVAAINSCAMPYISSLFPTKCRYSGVALSVTTGQALFGGTAPLVASWLTDVFESRYAPAFWLVSIALVATCSIYAREFARKKPFPIFSSSGN